MELLEFFLLFKRYGHQQRQLRLLMVEIAGGVGVGATVLKEAVEMMLIVTTKRSAVLLPPVLQRSNDIAVSGISSPQWRAPPVA